ncbi:MAG TPA: hypothetical protein VFD67_07325 [Gemmatimonadaceae bacterium]|nr:hypothetical protein [Gemmatimonadaceae bacterium]
MRIAIALVSLLLPAALNAQRIPLPRPRPARPAPLPPQPTPIRQDLAYRRLRLSVETYPMVSYFHAPAFAANGSFPSWATFGTGTRADYRLTRNLSATMDMTSSFLGGPALVETAELGTRVGRQRSESKFYPFADLRIAYVAAFTRNDFAIDGIYGGPAPQASTIASYSHGFGGIGGVGMEYALTRMFSLTSELSVMQTEMHSHAFENYGITDRHYPLTAIRYTFGVRFNPIRYARTGDAR